VRGVGALLVMQAHVQLALQVVEGRRLIMSVGAYALSCSMLLHVLQQATWPAYILLGGQLTGRMHQQVVMACPLFTPTSRLLQGLMGHGMAHGAAAAPITV
jgi:hypothetical protein